MLNANTSLSLSAALLDDCYDIQQQQHAVVVIVVAAIVTVAVTVVLAGAAEKKEVHYVKIMSMCATT